MLSGGCTVKVAYAFFSQCTKSFSIILSTKTYLPGVIVIVIVCFFPGASTLPSPGDVIPLADSLIDLSFSVGRASGAMSRLQDYELVTSGLA